MKTSQIPVRLLAEVLAIVALAQVCAAWALASFAPNFPRASLGALNAVLLVLLAAPAVYWRCMQAVRVAGLPRLHPREEPGGPVPQARQRASAIAMTAAAQLIGLALTVSAVYWMDMRIDEDVKQRFDHQVERIQAEIERRFQLPVYGMKGARGVYAVDRNITRAAFRAYVESRSLALEFPGVRGMGFIQRVERVHLDSFVAAEQADSAPDFTVRAVPPGDSPALSLSDDLYIVKFIEPLPSNHTAWGVDLGTQPLRRATIERAVATGQPTLTRSMSLAYSSERGPGFLYLLPIYRQGSDPVNPLQRRAALVGLVYTSIYAVDILAGVVKAADGDLDIELLSGDEGGPSQLAFSTAGAPGSQDAEAVRARSHPFQASRSFNIDGSPLFLRAYAKDGFGADLQRHSLAYAGLGGALLSFVLALAVWGLASSRLRATTLAQRMTADVKRTSAELARERQRLENILQGTRVGTWEYDTQNGFADVNERWVEMLGYTREELGPVTESTWLALAHPQDAPRSKAAMALHFGGEVPYYECEIRLRHKAGHWVWVLSRGSLFQQEADGHSGRMAGTNMDITERKLAETTVRESEHLMRLVTDNIPGRVAYWSAGLQLKFANKAFFEHFGRNAADSLGKNMVEVIGTQRMASIAQASYAALGGEPQRFEREERSTGGDVTHGLTQMIPDWRDGAVHGFVALVLDISSLKRVETELRHTNHALAMERDRAEQASVAKGQFLANMSHEIRTPMNAILGMLRLLRGTPLDTRQLDYATKTDRAARALLGLLNDILDFSKVEAGMMSLDPRVFSLDALLRDLSVILSSSLGDKPVEVVFDVDPGLPAWFTGDDMRLQQVLVNLASNAIKFTAAGEVVLRVRLAGRQGGACRLAFSVRDTGIGIAPEQQQQVFGEFSQAEASTTRRFGGTGLGLAICQRLVGLMGSRIELDSLVGVGSTFRFELELPVADGPPPPAAGEALRALVVDDNAGARAALSGMASSLGWAVEVAASGEEALDLVRAKKKEGAPAFGAVFIDGQMPGLGGWQAGRRLRDMEGADSAPPILVLMVTAQGREKIAEGPADGQPVPFDGFMVKPATASMLRDAVAEARSSGAAQAAPAAGPRLAGLRLLVVEDNPNNQQVAQELLEAEGADVTLAGDGEKGVAAVASAHAPFDAVLMDVQMPVMDGYTAARHIRRSLGHTALPIIAMTANAMPADREACLEAGMNDHIVKPFDLDELVALLQRHVRREASPDAADAAPAPAPRVARLPGAAPPRDMLDEAERMGIELGRAVSRLGGRTDVWARSARSFASQLPGMADELVRTLSQGGMTDAGRLMHTLKGLSATLGATELARLAAVAEEALGAGATPESMEGPRKRVVNMIEKTRADIEALLGLHKALVPQQPAQARAAGELRRRLGELSALLADGDMAATDAFADLQAEFDTQWSEELQPLAQAVSALDFGQALRECGQLQDRLGTTP